jgi:hypothetical protein
MLTSSLTRLHYYQPKNAVGCQRGTFSTLPSTFAAYCSVFYPFQSSHLLVLPKCDLCYVKFACIRPSNVTVPKTELPPCVSGERLSFFMKRHDSDINVTVRHERSSVLRAIHVAATCFEGDFNAIYFAT